MPAMTKERQCPCRQALEVEPDMAGPQDCPYPMCLSECGVRPQEKGHWGQINMHWSIERDVHKVAKKMGCSPTTVRRRLSEGPPVFRGWLSPYSRGERRERDGQIVKMYLASMPVAELAERFRLSRQRVWQVLGPRKLRPPRGRLRHSWNVAGAG
jgi:hypothetical protein